MNFAHLFIPSLLTLLYATGSYGIGGNPNAKRLFEDLTSDYNKMVRPVRNFTDILTLKFKLKFSQLLAVHEKNQIMTTKVWLEQIWPDYKLVWDPNMYGGIKQLYIPADMLWLPDIVLYNKFAKTKAYPVGSPNPLLYTTADNSSMIDETSADGNYQITHYTKAVVHFDGTVRWNPPAIFNSMCQINVRWFPFDAQRCELKFGSWTYGGKELNIVHKDADKEVCVWAKHPPKEEMADEFTEEFLMKDIHQKECKGQERENIHGEWTLVLNEGMDLSEYYPSVEWDILGVPATRYRKIYPCCESPFIDITYVILLRRKILFYTVNLIFPAVGISFLTALVFYIPTDSCEKISLCISILISLTVFFLMLVEIIPATSVSVPLVGKYLLFTMVLVTLSVVVTVFTINVHYRSPTTHDMPQWIRTVFIDHLPKYLLMERPKPAPGDDNDNDDGDDEDNNDDNCEESDDVEENIPPAVPPRGGITGGVYLGKQSPKLIGQEVNGPGVHRSFDNTRPVRGPGGIITTDSFRRSVDIPHQQRPQLSLIGPPGGPAYANVPAAEAHARRGQQHGMGTASLDVPTYTPRNGKNGKVKKEKRRMDPSAKAAMEGIGYIADQLKSGDEEGEIKNDWKYVALVCDRVFLAIFSIANFVGTIWIVFTAPPLYDQAQAVA